MNKDALFKYINKKYKAEPVYKFKDDFESCVFLNTNNKWFMLFMNVSKSKFGFKDDSQVEIINLKCYPELNGSLRNNSNIFPAYHMNKEHWITIFINEIEDKKLKQLIDISYELTKK